MSSCDFNGVCCVLKGWIENNAYKWPYYKTSHTAGGACVSKQWSYFVLKYAFTNTNPIKSGKDKIYKYWKPPFGKYLSINALFINQIDWKLLVIYFVNRIGFNRLNWSESFYAHPDLGYEGTLAEHCNGYVGIDDEVRFLGVWWMLEYPWASVVVKLDLDWWMNTLK